MLGSCQGRRRQGRGKNGFRACRKFNESKEAEDQKWDVLAARGDIHDRPSLCTNGKVLSWQVNEHRDLVIDRSC